MKLLQRMPASHWSSTPLARIVSPMQKFIGQEASSGVILLAMTLIALLLANSPLAADYFAILETEVGISIGTFELHESVLHWINDGLMVIFFFVVGLEIKRELIVGELASLRAASLPIIAACGGVIMPATIYTLFNAGGSGAHGWAVPTATDIAFAIGCMALLGSRVPFGLKIFLTAVAIVDDLIAVLVIALFYTSELNLSALGIGLAFWLVLLAANMYGIRNRIVYASIGVLIWLTFLRSGVHATIAGVLIAFTVPSRYRIDAPTFLERARSLLAHFEQGNFAKTPMLTDETQQGAVIELEELCEQVQAPLQKFEHSLHGWVALLIMPLFALANAGVPLALNTLSGETSWVAIGVILGLVLGKPIGLIGATWLTVRFGIADLPQGATWRHMIGMGMLAGIGFTMSLFIATLGFSDATLLDTAKLSVLIGSLISGTCGLLWLSRMRPASESA